MITIRNLSLIIIWVFCFSNCKNTSKGPVDNTDEVTQVESVDSITELERDDPVLEKFKDTAQAQLNYLINFISSKDKTDSMYEYFIKSPFIDGDKIEHMWSQVFEHRGNYFIGVVTNEPQTINNISDGDTVKVYDSQIEDWILKDYLTNTEVGGFSQEYLRQMRR